MPAEALAARETTTSVSVMSRCMCVPVLLVYMREQDSCSSLETQAAISLGSAGSSEQRCVHDEETDTPSALLVRTVMLALSMR